MPTRVYSLFPDETNWRVRRNDEQLTIQLDGWIVESATGSVETATLEMWCIHMDSSAAKYDDYISRSDTALWVAFVQTMLNDMAFDVHAEYVEWRNALQACCDWLSAAGIDPNNPVPGTETDLVDTTTLTPLLQTLRDESGPFPAQVTRR